MQNMVIEHALIFCMNGTLRICAEHGSEVQSKKCVLVKQLRLEITQELL